MHLLVEVFSLVQWSKTHVNVHTHQSPNALTAVEYLFYNFGVKYAYASEIDSIVEFEWPYLIF